MAMANSQKPKGLISEIVCFVLDPMFQLQFRVGILHWHRGNVLVVKFWAL